MQQLIEFAGNHLILFLAAATILSLIIANEVHGNVTGVPRISAVQAVRMINDRDPLLVDVRSGGDYKKGHLINAAHIPAQKLATQAGELGKDKKRPIIVYCALGPTSREAANNLRKQGFEEVYALRGGINGWLQANQSITTK